VAEPILELVGLRKSYGALRVTDDLSLKIAAGGVHALIGPNGAGKTSLIGQISGSIRTDAGTVRFRGQDITRLSMAARVRRGMARSFQITTLLPGFTALDNVAVAVQARAGRSFRLLRRTAGDPELEEPAMAALDRVGLAGRARTPAAALSHGEQRQLEIAVALATEPSLLVLDEPMAGTGRHETGTLIDTLGQLRGRLTILLVEHDMGAVFALADTISVLVGGRLIATAAPAEIRDDRAVRRAYLGEAA
jgi:branched-chain amino acid transport system ATP-binding protein